MFAIELPSTCRHQGCQMCEDWNHQDAGGYGHMYTTNALIKRLSIVVASSYEHDCSFVAVQW
jgi:hypothetical protein